MPALGFFRHGPGGWGREDDAGLRNHRAHRHRHRTERQGSVTLVGGDTDDHRHTIPVPPNRLTVKGNP
ncbi:hypothetical protein GCM10010331_76570 [Streptomyces xanthochromogenes]|nr:hypothetical protein GCM10010331_76570 [Streptomyces xanthochromogenes]